MNPRSRRPARLRTARSVRGPFRPAVALGVPPHPFRYALVATLGVGCGLAILAAIGTLGTVLVYVGVAFFLAIAVEPLIAAAGARRVRRGPAVLGAAMLFLLVVALAATTIIPAISSQLAALAGDAFAYLEQVPEQAWYQWLTGVVGNSLDVQGVAQNAAQFLANPDQLLGFTGGLLRVGTGIVDAVTGVIIVTVLTVYFVLTLPAITAKAYSLVSFRRRREVKAVGDEILQSVGRYVGGQIVLAISNAMVTFVVTAAVGSPAPALLAVIAFIGALIPVVGPVIGAGIATIVTLDAGVVPALVVAGVLLVYLQLEAYVLTPRVMHRAVAVPGALVIVAALGGAALGGVLGAFVAVPVAAAGMTIIDRVIIPHQQGRKPELDGAITRREQPPTREWRNRRSRRTTARCQEAP